MYTYPAKNTQVDTLSSVSTQAYTLPAVSTQAYTLPAPSTQAPTLPAVFELPRVSAQVNTGPAVSTQYPPRSPRMLVWPKLRPCKFPWFHPPLCKFLDCLRRLRACLHFLLGLQCFQPWLIPLTLPVRVLCIVVILCLLISWLPQLKVIIILPFLALQTLHNAL